MVTHASIPQQQEQFDSVLGPTNPQAEKRSFIDVLVDLAVRKRLILQVAAAFFVVSLLIALLLPPKYTASSTILPPQQNSSMASMLTSQLSNIGGMAAIAGSAVGLKNPNDMYVAMLKSRTVEDAMIQQFGLIQQYRAKHPSDARRALEEVSKIDGSGKDGLIHISVLDRDPKRAAEMANGYVEQYRRLSEHLALTEASQRRLFFERQLEQSKDNLANAEEAMKRTEQQTGFIQLDSQSRALIEAAAVLRAQISAKEVQIHALETFAADQNADLVQARNQLEAMRGQLTKLGGSEDSSSENFIIPKGKVPEAGLEYVRKLRDVKYYETIFTIIARQFETAKLDEAKQGAVIQVVDAAVPPDRKSSPQRTLIVLGGTFLGLLIGSVVAFLLACLQRLRKNPESRYKLASLREALSVFR
jgi:tyrosine-protein kinase Etk/Wzc